MVNLSISPGAGSPAASMFVMFVMFFMSAMARFRLAAMAGVPPSADLSNHKNLGFVYGKFNSNVKSRCLDRGCQHE